MGFLLQFFDVHSFNSQPPEGGWSLATAFWLLFKSFQLTAARRRLGDVGGAIAAASVFQLTAARRRLGVVFSPHRLPRGVSTHSRPKAAGCGNSGYRCHQDVSTHSRPKAAGALSASNPALMRVSTHSRPKAAGHRPNHQHHSRPSFNSQPPEGGWSKPPAIRS